MSSSILTNIASVEGLLGLAPVSLASAPVSTSIVSGLTITKTADQSTWVGGPLTYTITVTNNTGEDLTLATIVDTLDITQITLDEILGVLVAGVAGVYTFVAGLLTVTIPDLADGDTVVVSFQVNLI